MEKDEVEKQRVAEKRTKYCVGFFKRPPGEELRVVSGGEKRRRRRKEISAGKIKRGARLTFLSTGF